MNARFLRIAAAVAAFLCVTVFLVPLSGQGQDVRHTVQIARDVYTFTGGGSNSSFVVTPEGVLVFDADIRNDDLAGIRKVTDKKIVYLLSSHASGDHSTGAWHFRADKPLFIATRNQINSFPVELKEFKQVQASVFQVTRSPGRLIVYLGCALLILGVFAMLYVRERRLWVWLSPAAAGSRARMALSSNRKLMDVDREFHKLRDRLLGDQP